VIPHPLEKLPPLSDNGSALVLVLLVTALLTTITVSFLSTSRVEQIAAKNFSRQNAASGLAEMATQQAMAQIQLGFNTTANMTGNYSSVVTTQPGAIHKYFFQSGNITRNCTVEQFSAGNMSSNGTVTPLSASISNATAYLNNLQNPSSNSSATTDRWTITGNASERINVFMENITTSVNGSTQLIGRIAFYVDDEGTKLNLNSATGNRDTLNAALRPLDIAALSSNSASSFASIVNGTSSNNSSSITSWAHFFRPEQVSAAIRALGGNFSDNDFPFLATATSSASSTANMTHLLTPWGTQRVFINELSTNATDGSGDASVRSIFEALTGLNATSVNGTYAASNSTYGLTGRGLQNVFGGNFSTKYTPLGVKQIAANILQMRDPNTNSVNASFSYSGPLLGSNSSSSGNVFYPQSDGIPKEYLGHAPYPVISEIGMSARLTYSGGGPAKTTIPIIDPNTGEKIGEEDIYTPQYDVGLKLEPVVEFYNPYPYPLTIPAGTFPRLHIYPKKVSFEMSWSAANGNFTGNFSIGIPTSSKPTQWQYSSWFGQQFYDGVRDDRITFATLYQANGNSTTIQPHQSIQTRLYYSFSPLKWGAYFVIPRRQLPNDNYPYNSSTITINELRNVKMEFFNIKLLANSNSTAGNAAGGHENTIRDWVRGDEIGALEVEMLPQPFPFVLTWNSTSNLLDAPTGSAWSWGAGANGKAPPVPTKTAQRISYIAKTPMGPSATFDIPTRSWINTISINDNNRLWTTSDNSSTASWLETLPTWGNATSLNYGMLSNSTSANLSSTKAPPSSSSNSTIPSDPSLDDSVANAIYASTNASDMREPFLLTGNYTCPADLGLVPTNQRWRRLRMQMQPALEGWLIPDWAMLDVISFGDGDPTNPMNRTVPVNINGRFHLPGNATVAPRTIGVQALAQVIQSSSADKIQDPMNPASSDTTDPTRFQGTLGNATTIASAIGNMTWSGNSTWGQGNFTSDPGSRRKSSNFPVDLYILPSEIMEIAGVADAVDQTDYNNSTSHFKWNEGRASALLPAVTTRSSFFTIYAYAQAGQLRNKNLPESDTNPFVVDSEAVTKTLVEVEVETPVTPTTPATYKIKKLYTQRIGGE
jgi:hypothetical protein